MAMKSEDCCGLLGGFLLLSMLQVIAGKTDALYPPVEESHFATRKSLPSVPLVHTLIDSALPPDPQDAVLSGVAASPQESPDSFKQPPLTTWVKCDQEPTDLMFLLDCSASIWGPDWDKLMDFIVNLTESYIISESMTRVGVVSFSETASIEFRLNDFQTQEQVVTALRRVQSTCDRGLKTNTAAALRLTRTRAFSPGYGARKSEGVIQLAFLFTDGKSMNRRATLMEALYLHILTDIQLFVVGIGKGVDLVELQAASRKNELISLRDYSKLDATLKEKLKVKMCEKSILPIARHPLKEPIDADLPPRQCGTFQPADLVFITDPYSTGPTNARATVDYIKNVSSYLPIGESRYRVAILPEHSCVGTFVDRPMGRLYNNKADVTVAMDAFRLPTLADYANQAQTAFSNNPRSQHRKIAVAFLEGGDKEHLGKVAETVADLEKSGVKVIVIGIGSEVTKGDLERVQPVEGNRMSVAHHGLLGTDNLQRSLLDAVCVRYKRLRH